MSAICLFDSSMLVLFTWLNQVNASEQKIDVTEQSISVCSTELQFWQRLCNASLLNQNLQSSFVVTVILCSSLKESQLF